MGSAPDASTTVSKQSSTSDSPSIGSVTASDDLPVNVSTEEQLNLLPDECLSGNPSRPLRHIDDNGRVSTYALQPLFYSVVFILMIELLERFAFYGINYTQTAFLTGVYNEDWNADMDAVSASTYVSFSILVAYTLPFFGAFLADSYLGDYWTVLLGCLCFYLPGLIIILLTTIPGLLGDTFNRGVLSLGLLFLWPAGTGIIKSVVNVFGAKQYHPLLQSSLIESYFVRFYMCINIGALVGGMVIPVLAQSNVTAAYTVPVVTVSIGLISFVLGTKRYVIEKPTGRFFDKRVVGGINERTLDIGAILRISLLVIPFNIAYSQMSTTFIIQGTVMAEALGFIDAACMNNADAVAVLFFGYLVGSKLYPFLAERGIKLKTTQKFAIGSLLGAIAILYAVFVDHMIVETYRTTGEKISILWQALPYILIGAGEIFAVSAAYEVAFTAAPPEKKALASAINLFCIGGLPNVICIFLYQVCRPWFRNSHGSTNISHLHDYATANVSKYFWLLALISTTGIVVNVLPSVRDYVDSIEEKAVELLKSPKTPSPLLRRKMLDVEKGVLKEEVSPLLRIKRHQAYLKYGSGPQLHRLGSMRAGSSIGKGNESKKRPIKRSMLSKLYTNDSSLFVPKNIVRNQDGTLMVAGALLSQQQPNERQQMKRSSSDTFDPEKILNQGLSS